MGTLNENIWNFCTFIFHQEFHRNIQLNYLCKNFSLTYALKMYSLLIYCLKMENTAIFCPFSSGKYYKILYAYFSFYKQMKDNSKVLWEELQELSHID